MRCALAVLIVALTAACAAAVDSSDAPTPAVDAPLRDDGPPALPDVPPLPDVPALPDVPVADVPPPDVPPDVPPDGPPGLPPVLVRVEVRPAAARIACHATQPLAATAFYLDAPSRDVTTLATWASSAPSAVAVDASGRATAMGPGRAAVTATFAGQRSPAADLESGCAPPMIVVAPTSVATATGGETFTLAARYVAPDGERDVSAEATWAIYDPALLHYADGLFQTGNTPGATRVSANWGGLMSNVVTVDIAPTMRVRELTIDPRAAVVLQCNTLRYRATATYADGRVDTAAPVAWSVAPAAVGSIDPATGEFRAGGSSWASGTATVTATLGGATATTTVTVPPWLLRTVVTDIVVEEAAVTVAVGHTTDPLGAVLYLSDGCAYRGRMGFNWTSSAPGVATVDTYGRVTGVAPGTATVCATLSLARSHCTTVTVVP